MLAEPILATLRPSVVAAGGALSYADAEHALIRSLGGGRLSDEVLRAVLERSLSDGTGPLLGLAGQVLDVETTAERLVLTHRITDDERATGCLDLALDLAAFGLLTDIGGGLHLPDGTPLRRRERRLSRERSGVTGLAVGAEGPDGWLAAYEDGQVIVAQVSDGYLHLGPVSDDDITPLPLGPTATVQTLLTAVDGDGGPVPAEELLLAAALTHPDWFATARPPLGELVALAGLEHDHNLLGQPGVWQQFGEDYRRVAMATRHQDLPQEATRTTVAALHVFGAWLEDRDVIADPTIVARLHRHWLAVLAIDDELQRRGTRPEEVEAFALALADRAGGDARAAGLWLAARNAARAGRTSDGARLARDALAADGDFVPAIDEVAWYADDAGQAREALNLLQRTRPPDDSAVHHLQRRIGLLAPTIGRNSPCPCGSGRKFKQCHLGRVEMPEGERVRWLLDKAREYVGRVAPPELVDEVLHTHCDNDEVVHILAMDVLLFDEGWIERFVDGRRELLDAWEVTTAERWLASNVASVFRVDGFDEPSATWSLCDAADGTARQVADSATLDVAELDRLVWCRLLPVGEGWYTSGIARPVFLHQRAWLLGLDADQADPVDRVGALLDVGGGQAMANTSGEPLVFCEATLEVADAATSVEARAKLVAELDALLTRDPTTNDAWTLTRDTENLDQAIIAGVRLEADRLVTSTNSIARHDELLARLADGLWHLTTVSDTRVPFARQQVSTVEEDLVDAARRIIGSSEPDDEDDDGFEDDSYLDDPYLDDDYDVDDDGDGDGFEDVDGDGDEGLGRTSPDLQAGLDQIEAHLSARRERWLDQSIPALGGHTPRAAAADEELRRDLRTLLAEMGSRDERGETDAAYYRDQLGLPEPPRLRQLGVGSAEVTAAGGGLHR